jgi:uncharacterized Rmd1/YagE family protein
MRCVTYCIANSFKLNQLAEYFKQLKYQVELYRNVLEVFHPTRDIAFYFFGHGSFVLWGLTTREERALVEAVKPYAVHLEETPEYRQFSYRYANKTRIYLHQRFHVEIIALESNDTQIKLAISYGLAQSIKLESYEETVQRIIRENTPLFESLAKTGKVMLTKAAITQRMGQIFLARSSVNLNNEYLDTPEYFWEYSNLESYYSLTTRFLDFPQRVSALNQQLDVLHELFNMLNGQLQHQHTSVLEIIIIALIGFEIVLSTIQMILWHHNG